MEADVTSVVDPECFFGSGSGSDYKGVSDTDTYPA
jgi:hypothetical protein